jgi:hypothetical protein
MTDPHQNLDDYIDGIVARLGDLDRRHPPIRDIDPDFDGEEDHRR